jgi:hypothetical protein
MLMLSFILSYFLGFLRNMMIFYIYIYIYIYKIIIILFFLMSLELLYFQVLLQTLDFFFFFSKTCNYLRIRNCCLYNGLI